MDIPALDYICSFLAMASAISSYFVKNKKLFLIVQTIAIAMFALSSFFKVNYLTMFIYLISIVRMAMYYGYEKADKSAPFLVKTFFAVLIVVASLVINAVKGVPFNPIELLVLVGSIFYTYSFGIRNLKLLRIFFIIPTALNIAYYALIPNSIFYLMSYSFELGANLFAMLLYRDRRKAFAKRKQKMLEKSQQTQSNEQ